MAHFSERWGVRPDHGNPNILGAIDVLVMILPLFEAAPASVVGGDNERDLVAICRHGLHRIPKLRNKRVILMRGLQHKIVFSFVSPIVRAAVAHKKSAWVVHC